MMSIKVPQYARIYLSSKNEVIRYLDIITQSYKSSKTSILKLIDVYWQQVPK